MFTCDATCGWCNRLANFSFEFVREYFPPAPPESGVVFIVSTDDSQVTGYGVACCPWCCKPDLFLFSTRRRALENIIKHLPSETGFWGGQSIVSRLEVYPAPIRAQEHPSWPEKARQLFASAQRALAADEPAALVVGACRSVLELAVVQLGGDGRDLRKKIDDLAAKGVITAPMQDWSHRVRIDGNAAVHEIEATADQARELVSFVAMFLDMCFTLPASMAAAKAPEAVKAPEGARPARKE